MTRGRTREFIHFPSRLNEERCWRWSRPADIQSKGLTTATRARTRPRGSSRALEDCTALRLSRLNSTERFWFRAKVSHPCPCIAHRLCAQCDCNIPKTRRNTSDDPYICSTILHTTTRNDDSGTLFVSREMASDPAHSYALIENIRFTVFSEGNFRIRQV